MVVASSLSLLGGWGEWLLLLSVDTGGHVVAVVVKDGQSEGLKEIS